MWKIHVEEKPLFEGFSDGWIWTILRYDVTVEQGGAETAVQAWQEAYHRYLWIQ